MMSPEDCEGCVHARLHEENGPEGIAKCHRYPGIPIPVEGGVVQFWPDAIGGCGEFRR